MTPSLTKILCAEDEEKIRIVTKMTLERLGGFTVTMCSTGREVLETVSDFEPDLILLDVRMPEMSGPEIFEALSAIPAFKEIPVVFMTANVLKEDVDRYRAMGVADVIAKPFKPPELPDILREIWAHAKGSK